MAGKNIIDIICAEIADDTVELALALAEDMPVNEGQRVLCEMLIPDIVEGWEDVFHGNGVEIVSDHMEAVGIIVAEIDATMNEGAEMCHGIRESVGDLD